MKEDENKYHYLFRGPCYQTMNELIKVLGDDQPFEIWEQIDKTRESHLLIVYGKPLSALCCLGGNIWNTTEEIAKTFYYDRAAEFIIHRYSDTGSTPFMKAG